MGEQRIHQVAHEVVAVGQRRQLDRLGYDLRLVQLHRRDRLGGLARVGRHLRNRRFTGIVRAVAEQQPQSCGQRDDRHRHRAKQHVAAPVVRRRRVGLPWLLRQRLELQLARFHVCHGFPSLNT